MYLWLNGHFIGYAEDSFTPSFFDLTPFVREKDNVLAVQVHKQSTAGFLEDQDFFRFFGIFRDVNLYCLPALHVEDVWLQPRYDAVHGSGQLSGTLTLAGKMKGRQVHCCLYDPEDRKVWDAHFAAAHRLDFSADRMEVLPWEIYDGNVYRLEIQIQNEKGETEEFVPVQTGFRSIVLKNGLVLLNGRRLVINGVNRHEWSAEKGRCVGEREEIQDIEILKRNAINGVRTSHYPNRLSWYRRCDEAGIFLMAEVNLESHGSWQKRGAVEPSWNVPGECSPWFEGVLDRARTMFHTLKNHPAILFWSLGNESYAGRGLEKMQVLFKELDPERLVHYEGVYHHPAYKKTISDVESQMYAPPARIEAYLQNEGNKPFILCEFMHCMGNSVGGLGEYMELLDKYPAYQGGFIWDYMDQALWVKDPVSGEKVLAYGGDFDDRPTDYEFSGNGLLFADRTEKPAMQEVRYYYEKYKR